MEKLQFGRVAAQVRLIMTGLTEAVDGVPCKGKRSLRYPWRWSAFRLTGVGEHDGSVSCRERAVPAFVAVLLLCFLVVFLRKRHFCPLSGTYHVRRLCCVYLLCNM